MERPKQFCTMNAKSRLKKNGSSLYKRMKFFRKFLISISIRSSPTASTGGQSIKGLHSGSLSQHIETD
jgi:hypothetical protein